MDPTLLPSAWVSHAALSPHPLQHGLHLGRVHPPPFDQPDQQAQVPQERRGQRRWGQRRWGLGRRDLGRCPRATPTTRIELALLLPSGLVLVVGGAAALGLGPAMRLTATKRTAQVVPPGIAWVGEKEDAAMPATDPAPFQPRLESQHRSQHRVVPGHPADRRPGPMPAALEAESGRDLGCKKARLSLWKLSLVKAPLSYQTDPRVVEVGQGFFSSHTLPPSPPHSPPSGTHPPAVAHFS